ncbi:MAG: triose-phosphate isomerase [Dissulfurispiraceae bacterium]|jgi:triosephosphate isomerase|nr:triose-phosphate isomerase [Dissulfurispiraceae bacterium]
MRTPLISANWKMNKTVEETRAFFTEFTALVKDTSGIEIVVAPPFTSLALACELTKGTNVSIAAQNMHQEERGAFTGEISPVMVTDSGCSHVILGHSERRQYFCETDQLINAKIKTAMKHGINVIFCIGETLQEREAEKTFDVLSRELSEGLKDLAPEGIVIAYEPVWAIGTGKTATPEQAQEVHAFIRGKIASMFGASATDEIRILYGGSVTPENIKALMSCRDIDGALVGGASLKPDSFAKIINYNIK